MLFHECLLDYLLNIQVKYYNLIQDKKSMYNSQAKFKVGDLVSIQESKPISKLKSWIVLENLSGEIE